MDISSNSNLIDHIFRYEYGKMVSILVHKFGSSQLQNIEDAVHESLIKAMQLWPYKGTPKNTTGWLLRVATNKLIDDIRKDKKLIFSEDVRTFLKDINSKTHTVELNSVIEDSQLKMIFACCHPSISQEYQIILSLKLIGGFSNKEIAKALLKKEETIAKGFTRAKKKLSKNIKSLKIPIELGLRSRVNIVLKIIYLLFSEGYSATEGEVLIKKDICHEAIRLALLLSKNKYCNRPEVNALIALMCFHASRFEARIDENNELVDLEHHDRSKYDRDLIILGNQYLGYAVEQSDEPSVYHLQAAISYCYSSARNFDEIDWGSILEFYDILIRKQRSPSILLNRLISYSKVRGANEALKELKVYEKSPNFIDSMLYHAIKSELLKDLNRIEKSKTALKKAIEKSNSILEQRYFTKKISQLT
ncbi:sigma-70 family RNA polymerase sigma factor [Aureibaculum sp. 2210JD6-5]|uniref:RNA polymerase sigma factor n=1 Tax=Aureibaculum sp. 2210JD6-5 TaxID=3103957 RepID=UPI002AACC9D9|nr:sigma-70 family RNA polymerase sigma factor [Aureibaculum sp. 2210JD6-5]MDY7395353.1 sigma-70 family RNA polymerase sigma factor [Aureibaculum sp. 2210JD6-5]